MLLRKLIWNQLRNWFLKLYYVNNDLIVSHLSFKMTLEYFNYHILFTSGLTSNRKYTYIIKQLYQNHKIVFNESDSSVL